MKILVAGSRDWVDEWLIENTLDRFCPDIIVHGACRGADLLAAKRKPCTDIAYPAKWKEQGRKAGPIRNQLMLDDNPDIEFAIVFHDDLQNSKGTGDMVRRCLSKRIDVLHVSHEQTEWIHAERAALS